MPLQKRKFYYMAMFYVLWGTKYKISKTTRGSKLCTVQQLYNYIKSVLYCCLPHQHPIAHPLSAAATQTLYSTSLKNLPMIEIIPRRPLIGHHSREGTQMF